MPRKRLEIGLTKTDSGHRAFVRVRGHLYTKRFDADATPTEMQDWRAATRTDALRKAKQAADAAPQPGTFAEDVTTYLGTVTSMPTYAEREYHMRLWVARFGTRTRDSITSAEIRATLEQWRASGKPITNRKTNVVIRWVPLSESACNNRRAALMHFFTVMNGKSGRNPARDVPKYTEPEPEPRGYPYQVIEAILATMRPSATRARLHVITWTGMSPASLKRVREEDVDAAAGKMFRRRRRKGKGTAGKSVPILPQAVAAFRELRTHDGYGDFDARAVNRAWLRAVASFIASMRETEPDFSLPRFTVKDLRHSFGTRAYEVTGDLRAVGELLDHSTLDLTKRYTLKAVDPRLQHAIDLVTQSFAPAGVTGTVTDTRKQAKKRR